jgi:hypothetical protein
MREGWMKKNFPVTSLHRINSGSPKNRFRGVLAVFLVLGLSYATLFIGVNEAHGQANNIQNIDPDKTDKPADTDKPPNTHVPTYKTNAPTDPPIIPTDPPVAPSDTPFVPSNTPILETGTPAPTSTLPPGSTQTNILPCVLELTPTATDSSLPTYIPTCTPTPIGGSAGAEAATDTVQPGALVSTSKPTLTLPPTNTAGGPATAGGADTASNSMPELTEAEGIALFTPTGNGAVFPGTGTDMGSGPLTTANGMPYLLFLATLMIGGGAFFAFTLRNRRQYFYPAVVSAEDAATMAIHPATVGAFGFTAWLAGQAPILTQGEQVVLSKVRNGIGSASHLVGGISDLNKISEMGPQEILQLTIGPRLLAV